MSLSAVDHLKVPEVRAFALALSTNIATTLPSLCTTDKHAQLPRRHIQLPGILATSISTLHVRPLSIRDRTSQSSKMAASTMDPKQLFEVAKQIQKATDSGDSSASLLTILAPLEKFKATEDLLRQSKIGVVVTKLRQNKDPKVSEAATRLVSRWKQEVNAQSKKKRAAGESSPAPAANKALNGAAASSARNSATSSPAPAAKEVEKEDKKSKVDPEKRNTKTDNVNNQVTGDAVRDGCLKLMYDGIAFMSSESPDDVLKVARKVEVAAFEHFKQTTSADYKTKMRSLYQNLKMKPNDSLRKDVFSEKISAPKFGMFDSLFEWESPC